MTKAIRWTDAQLAEFQKRTAKPAPMVQAGKPKKAPKYRNVKVEQDGITHDSRKEARRWAELQQQQAAGLISDLQRQVAFVLAPAVRIEGEKHKKPALRYVCDFAYVRDGLLVVEDTKSPPTRKTAIFRAKKHLMATVHGISVQEV